jgi:hypothetical protein
MKYTNARIANVFVSSDGKVRVNVVERNDGLFQFHPYVERHEASGPNEGDPYWSPNVSSGLYASLEEAERNALNEVLAFDAKSKRSH